MIYTAICSTTLWHPSSPSQNHTFNCKQLPHCTSCIQASADNDIYIFARQQETSEAGSSYIIRHKELFSTDSKLQSVSGSNSSTPTKQTKLLSSKVVSNTVLKRRHNTVRSINHVGSLIPPSLTRQPDWVECELSCTTSCSTYQTLLSAA